MSAGYNTSGRNRILEFISENSARAVNVSEIHDALKEQGTDVNITSVFISALIFMIFGISLEAYVGVIISVFIIKSGIELLKETLDDILGKRADADLSRKIKEIACQEPEVYGAYDLFVNNYGPDKNYASLHVELDDTLTVDQVDVITRRIQEKVYLGTGVVLTGVVKKQ